MERPHLPRHAIARKQEPAADHIDRADDDAGACRVFAPFPVVGEFASQGADRQKPFPVARRQFFAVVRELGQALADRLENLHVILERASEALGDVCRLVDDRPPVDHIDEPPRQRHGAGSRLIGQRDQPDRHHQGFSEPGRDVAGVRHLAGGEALEQPRLPAERAVAGQGEKRSGKTGVVHGSIDRTGARGAGVRRPSCRGAATSAPRRPACRCMRRLPSVTRGTTRCTIPPFGTTRGDPPRICRRSHPIRRDELAESARLRRDE